MKNKILKYIYVALASCSITLTSCEDLDEDLSGVEIPQSYYSDDKTLESGLVGIFGVWHRNTWSLEMLSSYMGADDLTSRTGSNKIPLIEADRFGLTGGNSWVTNNWNTSYQTIANCNSVLENAEQITDLEEDVLNYYIANARFVRGVIYYKLASTFGDVPMPLVSAVDLTIKKTQKRKVMQQAIDDLTFAMQWAANPRDTDPMVADGHASKTAAKAYLAKVYLHLTGWPYNEADKWAQVKQLTKEIIDGGVYSLTDDFAHSFQDPHQINKEVIFSHYCQKDPWPFATHNRSYGLRWANWMDFYMEWTYFNNFPEGYRKEYSTATTGNPFFDQFGNPVVTKFTWGTQAPNSTDPVDHVFEHRWQTSNDNIAIRYAEILLIYAEACANTGDLPEAREKLNYVKRRAYAGGATKQADVALLPTEFWKLPNALIDYTAISLPDKDAIVDAILTEKAYEFLGEIGGVRWFDLVRHELVGPVNDLRDPIDTADIPLVGDPYDNSLWFTPIPDTETVLNPNLLLPAE
ncbi:RagB/SusD family nutrient uptake outer membrane protein [Ochrovirga pacifica]|uniref:RagB/SusD family nutrient uptake outer membrane protein n=1 Tax=Ochrovirga pacifica TaxID=1042376 RepID=UPI0002557B5B|nr:RagB/SusD family nutrient uptake outer membrane protein [Ochrovirga pacifica]